MDENEPCKNAPEHPKVEHEGALSGSELVEQDLAADLDDGRLAVLRDNPQDSLRHLELLQEDLAALGELPKHSAEGRRQGGTAIQLKQSIEIVRQCSQDLRR